MPTLDQIQAELDRRAKTPSAGGGVDIGKVQAELDRRRQASGDDPSLLQQLFDVKNTTTGESYIYGNRSKVSDIEQGTQDFYSVVGDTATRGFADKLAGPEAQARTAAARERMPDIVETPLDIATAVVTSPYRVGSTMAGAGFGALEGAASAYGNQENWLPDWQGAKDIVSGGLRGAALGGLGAHIGGNIGAKSADKAAQEALPGQIDEGLDLANKQLQQEILDAYDRGDDALVAQLQSQAAELAKRSAKVDTIRAAQGSTRDTFAEMMAGMEKTPEMTAKVAEASKPGLLTRVGQNPLTQSLSYHGYGAGGAGRLADVMATGALEHLSPIPGAVTGTRMLATGARWAAEQPWANRVPDQAITDLTSMASGVKPQIDPLIIDRLRDRFAKIGIGMGRSD